MWASKLLGIIGGTLLCSLLDYVGYVTKALHGHLGSDLPKYRDPLHGLLEYLAEVNIAHLRMFTVHPPVLGSNVDYIASTRE
jgi:hypothetical protein